MAGTRFAATIAAISLSLMATAAVFAQPDGAAPPSATRGDRLAMYRAVGIDKDQEAKLNSLAKEFEDSMLPATRTLIGLMREMHALSLEPDPDHKAVLAKQDEINKANGQISLDRIKFALKMRNVLNPEQKEKFVHLMQQNLSRTGVAPGAVPAQ